jgi:hypothetical protein
MSKKIDDIQKMIDKLEADVNKQLKVSQKELDIAYEKTEKQFTKFEKQQDKIFEMFENTEISRQADLELKKIAKEVGINFNAKNSDDIEIDRIIKEALRGEGAERKIDKKGSVINTAKQSAHHSSINDYDIEKEYQQLLKEVEQEKINKQSTLQPSSGLSIEEGVKHRGSNISNMIKDQGSLADEFAKTSSNPQEKTQLKTFSEDATKLSKIVDKVTSLETTDKNVQDLGSSQAKEKQQSSNKLMSGIAQASEKLYSGLKSGISTAINKIKELGAKYVDSIKSWFSPQKKEQGVRVDQSIASTNKALTAVKKPPEKLKEAKKDLQNSFENLANQYGKIIPKEKQAAFQKLQDNKVANKMTTQELIAETKKIMGSVLKQHVENTQQGKQKLLQSQKDRMNKRQGQKSSTAMYI